MRVALSICVATVRRLGQNWGMVLRICALPLFVPIAILLAITTTAPVFSYDSGGGTGIGTMQGDDVGALVAVFVLVVFLLLGTFYVAIAWHRYALLGEGQPLNHLKGRLGLAMGYLWRSLFLGLIWIVLSLLAIFPLVLVMTKDVDGNVFITFGAVPWPATPGNIVISGIALAAIFAAVLRMSLILPAVALGRPMTLRQSQEQADKHRFSTYFWIGLIVHFSGVLLDLALWDLGATALGGILVAPFLTLFWVMFGIALLTTLYARIVDAPPAPTAEASPDQQPPSGAEREGAVGVKGGL